MAAEPGTFAGILGNETSLRLLGRALAGGEVSHAYLLHGPPGVGNRTVARRLGAALVAGGVRGARTRGRPAPPPARPGCGPEGAFTRSGPARVFVIPRPPST